MVGGATSSLTRFFFPYENMCLVWVTLWTCGEGLLIKHLIIQIILPKYIYENEEKRREEKGERRKMRKRAY